MNSLVVPPYLKKNDKIAICSLASWCDPIYIEKAVEIFTEWGLNPIVYPSAFRRDYSFGGPDKLRIKDFQNCINDNEIKAIISTRGGYGSCRIIDEIDFSNFQKNPKWVIGFSDITTVLCAIEKIGFCSIHGPMPVTFEKDLESLNLLKNILFGEDINYEFDSHLYNNNGEAIGEAIGGNLTLLINNLGSKYENDFKNKILFLEEVGEAEYSVDRMMVQLKRKGVLKDIAGIVVGDFSRKNDYQEDFGMDAYQIIAHHTANYNYPKAFGFSFGHEKVNKSIRIGELIKLKVDLNKVKIKSFEQTLV